MGELPLSVAAGAVIAQVPEYNNETCVLFIRRIKNPYKGLLALPGGKIETNEHISCAAVREIHEETGIHSTFDKHIGVVSERLIDGSTNKESHFILHLITLTPQTTTIVQGDEGEVVWVPLSQLDATRESIVVSDYLMVKELIVNQKPGYYNCIIKKHGEEYELDHFTLQ